MIAVGDGRLLVLVAIAVLALTLAAVAIARGERIARRAPASVRSSRGQVVYGRVGLIGLAVAVPITMATGSSWAIPAAIVVAVAAGAFAARRENRFLSQRMRNTAEKVDGRNRRH